MKYNYFYNSQTEHYEKNISINEDSVEPVFVMFENERVAVKVDRLGNVEFLNTDGEQLYASEENFPQKLSRFYVSVKDNSIVVRLPVIKVKDHYPNCDGEYDRWSEVEVDNVIVTYKFA